MNASAVLFHVFDTTFSAFGFFCRLSWTYLSLLLIAVTGRSLQSCMEFSELGVIFLCTRISSLLTTVPENSLCSSTISS
ncbi:hypothetical protein EDC04DRAFT_2835443 [Pisolithus marmoratus]|nr:hypothetical protein EDC04DRAFT_2835443 [Pisolithus marmoratus]